ncbi:queuosine precursor transporter, partial [Yersinia pestis]|uniref:queuosine precursor transporter n=1 Tax=Yersinia pestis TaxID=632 RepID=UPI001C44AC96
TAWWVAPTAAMFFGNISDTMAFFFLAFYRSSDPLKAAHTVEIALVDYSFKLLICMLFFLPAYGVLLNVLLKYFARQTGQPVLATER